MLSIPVLNGRTSLKILRLGLLAKAHVNTDKYIKNSGLIFTILRNSLYADGLPVFFGEKLLETGIYLPAGDGKGSFAIRHEMAEAAANVLVGKGHENKVYNISNAKTTACRIWLLFCRK